MELAAVQSAMIPTHWNIKDAIRMLQIAAPIVRKQSANAKHAKKVRIWRTGSATKTFLNAFYTQKRHAENAYFAKISSHWLTMSARIR